MNGKTFTITRAVFEDMLAAALDALPNEACGLLAGSEDRAIKCCVITNADASPDHYSMRPEDQFAAIQDMRAAKLKMLAIWHSHPSTPARMSEEDMRLAYTPDLYYVIVSLAAPGQPVAHAFEVDNGVAREIPVVIEEGHG
ncbi:MAG: Mov34/MPN/PAD-1 family protein [Kiritimatiellia bacterium]